VLEHRQGAMALAADAYETVARLADEEYEAELLMDSQQRLGFCLRQMGLFDEAERTYEAIERTAKRRRLRSRVLRARIGLAGVTMLRGDLPRADSMCGSIVRESERHQLLAERASALQLQSVVAARREDMGRAVRLAHEALQGSATQSERERILSDLAAYLILERRYDVAIDALRIVELTATTENVRLNAKVNVLIAAARAGYRDLFDRTRRELNEAALAVEARVNMLIESARGIRRFGNPEEAARLLHEAQVLAKAHQLSRSVIEIDRVRAEPMEAGATRESGPSGDPELAALIANDLRERVAALAT
jgi:tetratricopeptide (TPR) repeat protein